MNSEEIRKALEIIKEPITVNCIEYKYFDQENYDKITRVYDNCLWFANNLEQINLTVEKLEQEKQELINYIKEEKRKLEKNRLDVSVDYYVIRKSFLKEILSKIERSDN